MRIADLPFHERPLEPLLGFDPARVELDRAYAGYGWARVRRIWLADRNGERAVDDAIVVALHSPDDSTAPELELEFELPGTTNSAIVALTDFLAVWLPRLPVGTLVLALCNPRRLPLARLGPMITRPLWHADGDVESWQDDAGRIVLRAETWYTTA